MRFLFLVILAIITGCGANTKQPLPSESMQTGKPVALLGVIVNKMDSQYAGITAFGNKNEETILQPSIDEKISNYAKNELESAGIKIYAEAIVIDGTLNYVNIGKGYHAGATIRADISLKVFDIRAGQVLGQSSFFHENSAMQRPCQTKTNLKGAIAGVTGH